MPPDVYLAALTRIELKVDGLHKRVDQLELDEALRRQKETADTLEEAERASAHGKWIDRTAGALFGLFVSVASILVTHFVH